MKPLKPIFLLLALPLMLGTNIFAQTNEDGAPASVRFRIMALQSSVESDGLFYRSKDGFKPLAFTHYRPTNEMTGMLAPDGRLPFFTREQTPEGETRYAINSFSNVPNGSPQILVLAAMANDQLVMNSVADNKSNSDEDWLFINASTTPLAVMLGKDVEPFPIRAGQSVFHRPQLPTGKGTRIQIAMREQAGWERVYSTYWPIREGQRGLVIIVEVEADIRVKYIPESVVNPNGSFEI